jgi:regulatory protein
MAGWGEGIFLDFGQAYRKSADYCAQQERCESELRLKFRLWNLEKEFCGKILAKLKSEGFIDEKRYALSYAGGKFRINGWGRQKIAAGLRARSIPPEFIRSALASVGNDEYLAALENQLEKKLGQLGSNTSESRRKAMAFLISRGFEPALVSEMMRNYGKDENEA